LRPGSALSATPDARRCRTRAMAPRALQIERAPGRLFRAGPVQQRTRRWSVELFHEGQCVLSRDKVCSVSDCSAIRASAILFPPLACAAQGRRRPPRPLRAGPVVRSAARRLQPGLSLGTPARTAEGLSYRLMVVSEYCQDVFCRRGGHGCPFEGRRQLLVATRGGPS
jgi:hypothetical protein